ncbi:unnamed protein product, partial [Prunus brigantina]
EAQEGGNVLVKALVFDFEAFEGISEKHIDPPDVDEDSANVKIGNVGPNDQGIGLDFSITPFSDAEDLRVSNGTHVTLDRPVASIGNRCICRLPGCSGAGCAKYSGIFVARSRKVPAIWFWYHLVLIYENVLIGSVEQGEYLSLLILRTPEVGLAFGLVFATFVPVLLTLESVSPFSSRERG